MRAPEGLLTACWLVALAAVVVGLTAATSGAGSRGGGVGQTERDAARRDPLTLTDTALVLRVSSLGPPLARMDPYATANHLNVSWLGSAARPRPKERLAASASCSSSFSTTFPPPTNPLFELSPSPEQRGGSRGADDARRTGGWPEALGYCAPAPPPPHGPPLAGRRASALHDQPARIDPRRSGDRGDLAALRTRLRRALHRVEPRGAAGGPRRRATAPAAEPDALPAATRVEPR